MAAAQRDEAIMDAHTAAWHGNLDALMSVLLRSGGGADGDDVESAVLAASRPDSAAQGANTPLHYAACNARGG